MDDPTRERLKRLCYQAAKNARERGLTGYPERFYKMLDALDDGKELEGLEGGDRQVPAREAAP